MRYKASVSLAIVLVCSALFGQSVSSGTPPQNFHVTGTVTDPTGALIPGGKVTFQGEQRKTVPINNAGVYEVDLPLGDYTMTAAAQVPSLRVYRRPLFRVTAPLSLRFDIVLPIQKMISRVVVGNGIETEPSSYYGDEFFPAYAKEPGTFQLYICYGGLRSMTGGIVTYNGDKTVYPDPVFVAYNLFSLQADKVTYDPRARTITASGSVVAGNGLGATQRSESMTVKLENGEVTVLQ